MIRRQLMRRMHLKKEGMKAYLQLVCLRILDKLKVNKLDAKNCKIEWGCDQTFKIRHCDGSQNVVNFIKKIPHV